MRGRPWTEKELTVVRDQYPSMGMSRLGRLLNRHPQTVYTCATRMGLKPSREAGYRSPNFNGKGEITGQFMSHARKGAERRGYSFDLTVDFVHDMWTQQDKRCYYSGHEIGFVEKTASIDRLDSALPYIVDNVVLVHKMVNKMKLGRTHEEFLRLVHQIAIYEKKHA